MTKRPTTEDLRLAIANEQRRAEDELGKTRVKLNEALAENARLDEKCRGLMGDLLTRGQEKRDALATLAVRDARVTKLEALVRALLALTSFAPESAPGLPFR